MTTYNYLYKSREERKSFIRAKYVDKAFIDSFCSNQAEIYAEMEQAIHTHNLQVEIDKIRYIDIYVDKWLVQAIRR